MNNYNKLFPGASHQLSFSKQHVLDDLGFWITAFGEFGIDVTPLIENPETYDQLSLQVLDGLVEDELNFDADHQLREWIINDRAYEALGIIESDGPGIGLNGRLSGYAYSNDDKKEDAFINLVKTNVDRVVSQLELSNLTISATAVNKDDNEAINAINLLKENILEDNNFGSAYLDYIREGVTYGSGAMKIDYRALRANPDLAVFANRIQTGKPLTPKEFGFLNRVLKGHVIEYVPTFELIRYRGARGLKGKNVNNDVHRWLHRVQQIPLSEARSMFPQYADHITGGINSIYSDTNPHSYYRNDLVDTVTLKETYIRFRVRNQIEVPVQYFEGVANEPVFINRFAIAKVCRIEGLGIVDLSIDDYNHNMFPFATWTYSDTYRHSCGIGIVKYGRDPLIVHNMLHNGMLRYFGSQTKGGGFIDARLGLTQDQLNARTEPGNYIPVQIPDELQDKSLKDFIVDNRPPTFPSVYADLMSIESNAVNVAMSVPDVYKGIQSGSSGYQEQILQNQADMAHSAGTSALKQSLHPFGIMIYSNIQQFETESLEIIVTDPKTNQQVPLVINMPVGWYLKHNPFTNEQELDYSYIKNDITTLMFKVKIITTSIVPEKPAQKAAFYNQFFNNTAAYINNPVARKWLEGMNKHGFNLPGITETLQEIDEIQARIDQQQAESLRLQLQKDGEKESAELQIKTSELAIQKDKNEKDFFVNLLKALTDLQETQQKQAVAIEELLNQKPQ